MSLQDNTNDTLFSADFASLLSNRGNVHRPRWHGGGGGGTYFIISQAEKGTCRNTHHPPFTSAEYRLDNLEHAPRQWRLGNAVLFFRDRKNLSLKHVSQLKKSIFLNNQFDPQECPRWSEKASLPPPLPPCLLSLLCLVLTLGFCSGHGEGAGAGVLGRDLGVKFQCGSRNPASVILSSGQQTGHFVSYTLGAERSQERSRGYWAARIIRITLAVTSFPVGRRRQRLEWFAERNTYFYQALKLSLLMSGFQGYSMLYSHILMCQGRSRTLSPAPVEHTQERSGQARRQGGRLSTRQDFMPLFPPPHPLLRYTVRGLIHKERWQWTCLVHLLWARSCAFGPPSQTGKPRLGDCSCIAQLTWKLAVPKSLSKSAPWKKLVNSFLMRCESHDSWIHTFHKRKALTMYKSQLLRWRRRRKNSGAIWQEIT